MKSVKFLEDLQKAKGLNDTELAKKLGITQPAMSNLKAGRRIMENETCIALALELGIDPMQIIMAADIDRAERAGQKSLWEVFIQRMQPVTASILMVSFVTLFLTPPPANAAAMRVPSERQAQNINYAKLRRRLNRAITARFKRMFAKATLQPTTA